MNKPLWNFRIHLLNAFILGVIFSTVPAFCQSPTVLTVGLGKMFPTITDAVASIAEPFTTDYKIQVDVPYDGYVENGLDIDVAALSMDGHTLEITGALNVENNVTYYLGDDLEYWVSGDDVTTFEYVNTGGETARRVQGDSYNPDATYEYTIKNHLGSTMMTVNENGVLSGSIYDYFPYGKQELVVSFAGPQVTKTFTGKELDLYDGESVSGEDGEGRYYFGSRYYDADIGRWTSTDPAKQFFDSYAYAGNGYNPIGAVDPDGNNIGFGVNTNERNSVGHYNIIVPSGGQYYIYDVSYDGSILAAIIGRRLLINNSGQLIKEFCYMGDNNEKLSITFNTVKGEEKTYIFDEVYWKVTDKQQDRKAFLAMRKQIERINAGKEKYVVLRPKTNTCVTAFTKIAKAMGMNFRRQTPTPVAKEAIDNGFTKLKSWDEKDE